MAETNPTVVVLTALAVEYGAMRELLESPDEIVLADGTRLERGRLPGTRWTTAIAELGDGALTAAALTTRVVAELRPQCLLFVGVAGALKDDLGLGDVVVGTKVYAVHGGKQTPEGFLARPQAWHGSHRLLQAARSALRDLDGVRAHCKPIACGDVVVADERSALREHIRRTYEDAYAIETEGSGAAHAAHLCGRLDALVIRGVSDLADAGKAAADAAGSQRLAAARAAAVAAALLRRHEPGSREVRDGGEGPRGGLGGDQIRFEGGTYYGPVIGKITGRPD
ncbi:5'-methylthioadenosine/S-adenosylhomocysteine nucleosidase [Streptomyces sp. NPDC021608]|uniref:5'-methylthioadenosine/S-adenosylhomocysteine nucleosidase family protein n=1 Tax=Streptomyces sp. NPDC021608 TaxID=3154903 RepID=UPI0033EC6638